MDVLELSALPPLSPTIERVFSEAFADLSDLDDDYDDVALATLKPHKWASSDVLPTTTMLKPSLNTRPLNSSSCSSNSRTSSSSRSRKSTASPRILSVLSPTPASMASALHNQQKHKKEIRNISPSGGKKLQTLAQDGGMEDKRARRSAIEKKSRQRRQRVLKTMRDEVQQLETLYRTMVGKQKSTSVTTGGHVYWKNEASRGKSQFLAPARANTFYVDELALEKKYAELSVVAHTLEDDRRMLQQLLQPHQEFYETVESGFAEEKKTGEEAKLEVWDTGVPPSLSFQAEFTKLTTAECYALVRESYDAIQQFQKTEHFKSTGANFMGWTDKRKYDESSGALQYGFTKQFPLETAEGLLQKTWGIFTDARKFQDMSFDRSIRFRYQLLQQMNDDLVIIRRDHRIPNIDMTFASVQVLFRMQTPTGFTLCMRAIPSPEILRVQDAHEYFYDCFHWTHFNHMYDEAGNMAGCELMTAGSIADQSRLKSSYWLFEIVCSTLRWESACVAPLFLKQT